MLSTPDDPRPSRFRYSDTRRWVIICAVIGTVAYAALAGVTLASWGWDPARHPLRLILTAIGVAAGGVIAYRGREVTGGVVALFAVWCEVHLSLLTAVDFPAPAMLSGAAVVVAGAFLLRPRPSAAVVVCTVLATWPLVILSPAVRATGLTSAVVYWLVAHFVVTVSVWSLVTLSLSIVDRAFLELVRKEDELAETINQAPDGILVVDTNDLVQVVNPAAERLLGQSLASCRGLSLPAVFAAAGESSGDSTASLLRDSGERPRGLTLQRSQIPPIELEISWRAMESGRRQLVLRDVSERVNAERMRREMELQLSHAQRLEAVGQLAGGIAHDFNNILTIVGASAEVLRAELPDEAGQPLLDEIMAAQERGATLTRQLLAFARRDVVQLRVFDLSAQVLSLRQLLQRVAGEQTRMIFDAEPDCRIRADVGQVEQAIVNLVSNARDAMPNGGVCSVTVTRMTNDDGEPWVRLRVKDEGQGMDGATRERAFEPFFTTKPRGRGTGLGLAAVHGVVMQCGGRADIESAKGVGTTVMLEFPLVQAPTTGPEPRVAPTPDVSGGTILVAEDDDGTRAVVCRLLQRLGYTVLSAPDGLQALRIAEMHAGRIDLLLTDVMMPGLSGPKVAARLRERFPDVPVLFMSGYPEDLLSEVQGLNLETDFVAKPFASVSLAARVSEKLASRRVSPAVGH